MRYILLKSSVPILLSTALLGGCGLLMQKPVEQPPVHVAQSWEVKTSQSDISITTAEQLLDQFNDSQLNQLFKYALVGNYDFSQQAAQTDRAAAALGIDSAALWPELNLILDSDRSGGEDTTNTSSHSLLGRISWEIDLWGRLRDVRDASELDWEAEVADYQAARLSLAASLSKAWFDYQAAVRQEELSRENQVTIEIIMKLVNSRFRRGLATLLELRLARTNLASAKSDLILAKENLVTRNNALKKLLGQKAADLTVPVKPSLSNNLNSVPAGLPVEILRRRPDLVAAEKRYRSSVLVWQATEKSLLPGLSITATGGQVDSKFADLVDDSSVTAWSLSGQLLAPIFNAGRISAQVDRREALTREELSKYGEVLFNAFLEVNEALESEQLIEERVKAQGEVLVEAQATEKLALRDYGNGLTDLDTLLDAQRDAISAERNLVSAEVSRIKNRVDLLLALGGSFEMNRKESPYNILGVVEDAAKKVLD